MDGIARDYVRLVLAVGEHDEHFVDAYYGPQDLRPAEGEKTSLFVLRRRCDELIAALDALPPEVRAEPLEERRWGFLRRQIEAVAARLEMLAGTVLSFDEESRALYDAAAPVHSPETFLELQAELDRRLPPGEGSLDERLESFRSEFVISPERLGTVFTAAIDECRRRTAAHIELPPGESFTVEYVTGQPWSAYNWYQGGSRSLIQVNTDLPIHIDRAIDLACHEGYPGHHVYNALLEEKLVRGRGWIEFSVYPLFSPQSLIAEGTANFGIQVAFPGQERVEFERDVLFPLAGLDPRRAAGYYEVQELLEGLKYAGNEAARRYLDGEIGAEETARWLQRYALSPFDRAQQRVRFFDRYRSYVINYNLGEDLVESWVVARGGSENRPQQRWEVFAELLSAPFLPSQLAAGG